MVEWRKLRTVPIFCISADLFNQLVKNTCIENTQLQSTINRYAKNASCMDSIYQPG